MSKAIQLALTRQTPIDASLTNAALVGAINLRLRAIATMTQAGTFTAGDLLAIDANGNIVDAGSATGPAGAAGATGATGPAGATGGGGTGLGFTAPPSTGWTWGNQGSSTESYDPTYNILSLKTPAGGVNWRIYYRAVPGVPYTLTAAYVAAFGDASNVNCGLVLFDGTKIIAFAPTAAAKWNSYTSYSANYTSTLAITQGALSWVRVQDDGTNRTFFGSSDGVNWFQVCQQARTDFMTATQLGISVYNDASNFSQMSLLSWQVTTP